MSISANVERAKEDYDRAYEAGEKSEYDTFWDAFQNYGNRGTYVNAFTFSGKLYGWNDTNYNPKYPIIGDTAYGVQECFRNNVGITDTKVPIVERVGNLNTVFHQCQILKRIASLILEVPVTKTSLTFNECFMLEEINITCDGGSFATDVSLQHSTKLSRASIENVINALSTTTSGLTVTLSQTAVDTAFATTEGGINGGTSAEWLALVATRSNWTIALA